jgi:hypothetical protein
VRERDVRNNIRREGEGENYGRIERHFFTRGRGDVLGCKGCDFIGRFLELALFIMIGVAKMYLFSEYPISYGAPDREHTKIL